MSRPLLSFARAARLAAPLALTLLLGACAATPAPLPTAPSRMPIALAEGRPEKLHTGDHFAFWLWHDSDNIWHVRTTTAGRKHRFQGLIHPTGPGGIVNMTVTSVAVEGRHRHSLPAEAFAVVNGDVQIDFVTDGREDGIDFQVTGPTGLECDFKIDGDNDPGIVKIGQDGTTPVKSHFILEP